MSMMPIRPRSAAALVCGLLMSTAVQAAAAPPPPAPAAPPAHAAPPSATGRMMPLDITRPLAADGSVRIDNGAGSIRVIAWNRPEVRVVGEQPAAARAPEIESDARHFALRIRSKVERCWLLFACSQNLLPVRLTAYVPRGARLTLHSVSADAGVQGMQGPRLDVDTVSGELQVTQSSFAAAWLHSVSGGMRVDARIGRLNADSVSGDVRVPASACTHAQVTTISGEVDLGCANVASARLKSVSGDLTLRTTGLAPGGEVSLNTVSGDARLQVPPGVSARLDLGSVSGSIGGALPPGVTVREHSVSGRYGSGDGSIHVGTVSGDIRMVQGG